MATATTTSSLLDLLGADLEVKCPTSGHAGKASEILAGKIVSSRSVVLFQYVNPIAANNTGPLVLFSIMVWTYVLAFLPYFGCSLTTARLISIPQQHPQRASSSHLF